jgi:hypothetical protein
LNGEIYYRYYHLYKRGELEDEINQVNQDCKFIIDEAYEEKNNYIVILKKIKK